MTCVHRVPMTEPCWACDEDTTPSTLVAWPLEPGGTHLVLLEPTPEEIFALSL